jgi:arsenite methyltransferase
MNSNDIYRSVRNRYAGVASQTNDLHKSGDYERKVASAFGYGLEELRSIPENANLGVSCGNPLATANIGVVGGVVGAVAGRFLVLIFISIYRARW